MKTPKLQLRSDVGRWLPLTLGFFAVLLSLLPAILLGEDGYVGIHDQMDGEVLVYIMNARHFLENAFPEFMNGMEATSLTPPAYGSLLFYLMLPPFAAFLCNYIFVTLLAFVGMYLLLDVITDNRWLSAFVALLFAQLPFYSVYGLSVMGQPLLFYASLRLWKNEKPWTSFALTALFGAFSSLVLVGYADILLLLCFSVVMLLCKRPNARYAWMQAGVLLIIYLLPNLPLLYQILMPSALVSHKSELVAAAADPVNSFKTMFREGAYHAASLHSGIVNWAIFFVPAGFVFYSCWTQEEKPRLWGLSALVAVAAAIAAFYGLWHSAPVAALRNQLGGLFVSFQVDRVYWLNPTIWFMILALMIWLLWRRTKQLWLQSVMAWLCICVLICHMGGTLYTNSVFRRNVEILKGEQSVVSWDDFYSPELFQNIENHIGVPQEEYRVASVALYPSVPLYNGFYCIDGYSNNYNVEYKHQFRSIISKELEKADSLRTYYDGWGNRCYLFSAQLGKNYYFTKDSQLTLENLELSAEGLKQLGCSYLFSGLEITDPGASGLEFVEDFTHEDSPYHIWLYKVA